MVAPPYTTVFLFFFFTDDFFSPGIWYSYPIPLPTTGTFPGYHPIYFPIHSSLPATLPPTILPSHILPPMCYTILPPVLSLPYGYIILLFLLLFPPYPPQAFHYLPTILLTYIYHSCFIEKNCLLLGDWEAYDSYYFWTLLKLGLS